MCAKSEIFGGAFFLADIFWFECVHGVRADHAWMCDMTPSDVWLWHASIRRLTWFIQVCDMTHSDMWKRIDWCFANFFPIWKCVRRTRSKSAEYIASPKCERCVYLGVCYVYTYIHINKCIIVYILYIHIIPTYHIYICTCICIHICTYIHMYLYIYVHIYICIYIHIYVQIDMYINIYVYDIHVYIYL